MWFIVLLKLSNAGGRLVVASDGVWDALSYEKALSCCRGLPAESAATRIVKVLSLVPHTQPKKKKISVKS
jgi:serine/threonine protein phosphatase PrpC